jgi:hypothetical protein
MDRRSISSLILATPLLLAAASPTGVPEIAAQLPSGIYAGMLSKRIRNTIYL